MTTAILKGKSGFCNTAEMVGQGLIASSMAPEGWHRLCRYCTLCDCHKDIDPNTICAKCLSTEEVEKGWCVDTGACASRMRERWLGSRRARAAEKAERPRSSREPKSREPGRCEHCGGATRGGRFLPGHDAKLKGILWTAARSGDCEAMAECLLRGAPWIPKEMRTLKDPGWALAQALIDATGEGWLQQRVAMRIDA